MGDDLKSYLKRIGRSESDEYECTVEEQTVEHILTRCALTEDTRQEARERLGRDIDVQTLLYTQDGVEEAKEIWRGFVKARKEIKERQGSTELEDRWDGDGGFGKMMCETETETESDVISLATG